MARIAFAFVVGLVASCVKPDSIAFGEVCEQRTQCKAPSDECLTILDKKYCTKRCNKKDKCPEQFECLAMDIQVQSDGTVESGMQGGYGRRRGIAPPRAQRL